MSESKQCVTFNLLTPKMLFPLFAFFVFALFSSFTFSANKSEVEDLDLTIYHIEGRRSERVVWLCEELGLPYRLVYSQGDLAASAKAIREVSPLMAVAPTVTIGDQVVVESGAIMELLLDRYGNGRLTPDVHSKDYPYYLQWMHFSEGSLAARIIADYRVERTKQSLGHMEKDPRSRLVNGVDVIVFAEDFLSRNNYFGGKEFSAADIIMLFPINIAESFGVTSLQGYPHILKWREKIMERPAYKRMIAKARPDGIPGAPKALKKK
ncbi:MAG: glutathione S-transferase family protein [Cellvibrionaceae bacterium]